MLTVFFLSTSTTTETFNIVLPDNLRVGVLLWDRS